MFLHLSVSHSVHRGGVYPSACWDTHTVPGRHPLGRHPSGRHPLGRHPHRQTSPLGSACWDTHTVPGRNPSGRHPLGKHPPGQTPPQTDISPGQCMLGDTGHKRVVRILLKCILVHNITPRHGFFKEHFS